MSGSKYKYYIKKLPAKFDAHQIGNYLFAKLVKGKWVPIGIGEGDLYNAVSDVQKLETSLKREQPTFMYV